MNRITLPVIALRSMTVLPNMVIHFDISRKKSINATKTAMKNDQRVFLVAQKDSEVSEPSQEDVFEVGTVARITQVVKLPNKILRVVVEGIKRGTIDEYNDNADMITAKIRPDDNDMEISESLMEKAILTGLRELIRQYGVSGPRMSKDILKQWLEIKSAKKLLERFVIDFPMDYLERQHFLEIDDCEEMYEYAAKILIEEINVCRLKEELSKKVQSRVDEHQKEYVLREQLKVLTEELDGEAGNEIDEYAKQIEELNADEEIKTKLNKSLKRLKSLQAGSSEASVERTYIETLLQLPWNNMSEDNNDIMNAQKVLDEDHYGMKDIKERIIETLAVRNITKKQTAPVICLVGPPGTGKTSIAKSIARALNKEYIRICLGGVRDEAEIRGHRKTYVGAMPGRIIDGLIKAKVNNPLILLDEIDKISSDYKGDTSSALLEVLDGEQNANFIDHYVEVPVDLSNALFIATANDLSTLSRPLIDRMEIIEVGSYTETEKLHIAKEHLVKKQIKKNGLLIKDITFSDKAIKKIITEYTRESGVRNLERQIAKICRKAVKQLYEKGLFDENGERITVSKNEVQDEKNGKSEKIIPVKITDKNLKEYLGKEKYRQDKKNKKPEVGIVRGLAWTSVGGDTLEIEVNITPGKGGIKLTGNMGDVMKESAQLAVTYVKGITASGKYKIKENAFADSDIHLHIPEGAVPKDGPSAGITMATAVLSAFTEIPVLPDVAMTGEITLRGRVLPIGGLKEKLMAANNAGMKKVLVPSDNENDVEELDKEITDGMEIVYVSDMKQVLSNALYGGE